MQIISYIKIFFLIIALFIIAWFCQPKEHYTEEQISQIMSQEIGTFFDIGDGVIVYLTDELKNNKFEIDERYIEGGYQPWDDEYRSYILNRYKLDGDTSKLYKLDKATYNIKEFVCKIDPSKYTYWDFEKIYQSAKTAVLKDSFCKKTYTYEFLNDLYDNWGLYIIEKPMDFSLIPRLKVYWLNVKTGDFYQCDSQTPNPNKTDFYIKRIQI